MIKVIESIAVEMMRVDGTRTVFKWSEDNRLHYMVIEFGKVESGYTFTELDREEMINRPVDGEWYGWKWVSLVACMIILILIVFILNLTFSDPR